MSNENKKMALPKLRFPEFQEAEEWVETELGANGAFLRGLTYSSENVTDDGLLVVRSSNIQDENLVLDKDLVFVNINCTHSQLLQKGDVAICMANGSKALVGKSAEFDGEYNKPITIGAFCSLFRPINDFAKLVFKTKDYQNFVAFSIGGGNINNLKNSDLEKFSFFIPTISAEQQKIADTLSSLDDLLTAQSAKLEALKIHKRGLMQSLFPAEGETVPMLRFPDFQDAEEWDGVGLEKIAHKIMVGIASAATHAYRKAGIVLFRNQNIKGGHLDDSDILFIDEEYEKAHKNKRLKSGDILIARTGYPGTACVVPDKYEGSQSFTTLIVRPNKKLIDSSFLSLYINSEQGKAFFDSAKIGGGQQNVNAGSLAEMPIPYPSLAEQQKIADCLSSLDNRITAQNQKIEALKLHKKGLMQHLFPAAAEPTA